MLLLEELSIFWIGHWGGAVLLDLCCFACHLSSLEEIQLLLES